MYCKVMSSSVLIVSFVLLLSANTNIVAGTEGECMCE